MKDFQKSFSGMTKLGQNVKFSRSHSPRKFEDNLKSILSEEKSFPVNNLSRKQTELQRMIRAPITINQTR